jgi:disulfide bond formation protein DsbB
MTGPAALLRGLDRRRVNLLGFAACAGALAFAMYAQYGMGLVPCHLCIFQRVEVAALGLMFLLAALHNPGDAGARFYGILIPVFSAVTAITAGRHVWIQLQPPGSVPGCGADLDFMLEVLPLMQVIIKVFQAGGECAKVDFSVLGISMPGWVLVFAVVVGGAGVWANLRRGQTPQ